MFTPLRSWLDSNPKERRLSALDAYDLLQRVDDLDEIALRLHDGVDVLVRSRRLVDDVQVLAALDALRRRDVLIDGETLARLGPRHPAAGAMAAAFEALRVAEPANDVGARAHAARNDSELASARTHGAFARHEHVLAEVRLARRVVVMTVHGHFA